MREQTENLLSILKSALRQEPVVLREPVDYEALIGLAQEQNLLPLVGEMLCRDPGFTGNPLYGSVSVSTIGGAASQMGRTEAFLELYREFRRAGVYPLVMKGIVCRELYGELRDHRPSADEDILIRPDEFETAKQALAACGYEPEREETTRKQLEELQEVTFDSSFSGLHIEVHTNPIGLESGNRREMNGIFSSVFERAVDMEVNGTVIRTMGHTDHFLFLIVHAFKHFQSEGFGIRQVLDILLYEEKYYDRIDMEYVRKVLREIRADRFFADIVCIGRSRLGSGLPPEDGENCPEELLEDLMDNGIFGSREQASKTAASITMAALDRKAGDGGAFRGNLALLQTAFPPLRFMAARDPRLVDRPWLLPAAWLRRWGRFFRYNGENGGGLAPESIAVSRRRLRLLKKYRIV